MEYTPTKVGGHSIRLLSLYTTENEMSIGFTIFFKKLFFVPLDREGVFSLAVWAVIGRIDDPDSAVIFADHFLMDRAPHRSIVQVRVLFLPSDFLRHRYSSFSHAILDMNALLHSRSTA